ncbi:hypothetical protein D3C72_619180 [compost metagenome]
MSTGFLHMHIYGSGTCSKGNRFCAIAHKAKDQLAGTGWYQYGKGTVLVGNLVVTIIRSMYGHTDHTIFLLSIKYMARNRLHSYDHVRHCILRRCLADCT